MKQIIKGKTYNTENACCMGHKYTKIGTCRYELRIFDCLYQKRNGDFFHHVEKYEYECDLEMKDKVTLIQEYITPLSKEEQRKWWSNELHTDGPLKDKIGSYDGLF